MICPSCGWEQEEGAECVACGVVFAKFRARTPATPPAEGLPAEGPPAESPAEPPAATEKGGDPWLVEGSFRAQPDEAPQGDLYDPDAAAAPPRDRIGGIRVLRSMPRIGPLETIFQALEAVLKRPLWFGFLLLLQWGFAWMIGRPGNPRDILVAAGFGLFLIGFVAAATMIGFRAADRGLPIRFPDVLQAVARTPRYLLTLFLLGLLVGVVALGPAVGAFFLFGQLMATLLAIGWVLLTLIAATAIWGVAGPASVDERIGPIRAIGRSARLTDGSRWAIVGSQVIFALVVWGLQSLPQTGALGLVARGALALQSLVGTTWWAVLYYRLRSLDEGVPMDELESSLDEVWRVEPPSGAAG